MKLLSFIFLLVGFALSSALAEPPEAPKGKQAGNAVADDTAFTVVGSDVRLPAGAKTGSSQFIIKLSGTAAEKDCTLTVEPVATIDAVQLELERAPKETARIGKTRSWLVPVRVTSMPVLTSAVQRRLVARYCDASDILSFSLTNSFQTEFSWSVSGSRPQRWDGRSPLPITVIVGAAPATGVRLMPQQLVAGDLSALPKPLQLCTDASSACDGKALELSPGSSHGLWIRPPEGSAVPRPGTYAGSLQLVSDQDPKGLPIELKLHVSDAGRQLTGALLIFLGVILSFFVVRYLRQRADYLSLRRPLTLLQEELASLKKAAEGVGKSELLKPFLDAVEDLATELRTKAGQLPRGWEFWPMPDGSRNPLDDYQSFLDARSAKAAGLSILFWQGWYPTLAEWRDNRDKSELDVVQKALGELGTASGQKQLTPELALSEAKRIVKAMNDALAPLLNKRGESFDPVPAGDMSSQQLQFQLVMVNAAAWLIFAVLSWLVGVYLLILDKPDFGNVKDLLVCFLWGFGLPSAGEGLARLTPTSVGQSMGMTVVRGQG